MTYESSTFSRLAPHLRQRRLSIPITHSNSVFDRLESQFVGYEHTRGALHFPVDTPLTKKLLRQLIDAKVDLAFGDVDLKTKIDPDERWRSCGLAAPARRAFIEAGILTDQDLEQVKIQELEHLHGIGLKALGTLKELACKG